MGDVIQRKLGKYTAGAVLCILLLFFVTVRILWSYEMTHVDLGMVRVMSNQLLLDLERENGLTLTEEQDYELPYCVFSMDGEVLASTIETFKPGVQIDLHTIGSIYSYLVPVVINGEASVILYVDGESYQNEIAMEQFLRKVPFLFVIVIGIFGILFRRNRVMKADVWRPIQELHQVTKDMLEGKLESKLAYDYEGEIGTLCRDFESMREEVLDSMQREVEVKGKERALYASISHDLKTPLAIITGYLEELLYGVVTEPEEIQSTLERSLEKAMVLNKLIHDILEHSKAQFNQLSIHKEEVYARDYFEELLEGYSKDAVLQNYKFTYTLPDNVLIMIDRDRVAQVVQNLMDNAVKYRRTELLIEVKFEILEEPSKLLIVSVADNGKGIDAADLPFIFDMFYRGNKARTQDIAGSGLGLNISKYIVEQHGGQIECDSIAGAGTTMSFSIPFL